MKEGAFRVRVLLFSSKSQKKERKKRWKMNSKSDEKLGWNAKNGLEFSGSESLAMELTGLWWLNGYGFQDGEGKESY